MGSAAEIREPTTGTEKHPPIEVEEEDKQIVDLERKTSSFRHGKGLDNTDSSTITNTSSSSSLSGEGTEEIPYFRNGEEEHITPENLEVPESPEQGFHEGDNCNVYFDGEHGIWKCRHCDWTYREGPLLCFETKGSESAGEESDAHESQNGEKKQPESENGSSIFVDNKGSGEIEEVIDVNSLKELDAVDQPAGDMIEEEVEFDDAEYYDVEKVMDNQKTHDMFCPNCNSCITKRVVLKRRKRKIHPVVLGDSKRPRGPHRDDPLLHSEDNLPSPGGGENSERESFVFKCLSCFSIFIPTGVGSKPYSPSEGGEGLKTQSNYQEEATGNRNWLSFIFGSREKGSAVPQGGAMSSVPEANPRDKLSVLGKDTPGSTANNPSEGPDLVQGDAASPIPDGSESSASQDKKPVKNPLIEADANSDNTSAVVKNGATVEDGKEFLVAPSVEEEKMENEGSSPAKGNQTFLSPIQPPRDIKVVKNGAIVEDRQEFVLAPSVEEQTQKMNNDGSFPAEENHTPLSQIQPPRDIKVTTGPDGVTTIEVYGKGASNLFEETDNKVTGDSGVISGPPSSGIDILPVSSVVEGTLREPLIMRPVVEGRKLEILKSIVYGGLIESITSLGVISSAAGSGASTLNILVLGLANVLGGLILIIHNLQELREEEPRRITTDGQAEEEGRYKRLLGRRENFTLHATVAILSFIIVGLIPPIVYAFSFSKTHNRDYKVLSVFGSSLLCIVLLAIAKAQVKTPRGSYLKSILYYAMIAVSVSGISYVVGNLVEQFLEKHGWSGDSAGQMMLSLMGRKAGSFGYSSSY